MRPESACYVLPVDGVEGVRKVKAGQVRVWLICCPLNGSLNGSDDRFYPSFGADTKLEWSEKVGLEGMAQDGLAAEAVDELAHCNWPDTAA